MELEPTPAEKTSQVERISGEVDVGSYGMEPREGPRRTGQGRTGLSEVCLLLTAKNEWMCMCTCTHFFYLSEDFQ